MKKTLFATAALGLVWTLPAPGAPLQLPAAAIDRATVGAGLEGGDGGLDDGDFDEGLLQVHGKKKFKHGEGGEGGEGGPVIVERPVIHYVPLIPRIVGHSLAIVLEVDLPFFVEFEPRLIAAPVGSVLPWSNPDTGHYGEVAVLDERYDDGYGGTCRTYRTTVVIDGRPETAEGTACQEADGTWHIVN